IIKVTLREIINQLTAFIGGIGLIVCAVPTLYLTQNIEPWMQLICVGVAGGAGYISVIWFLEHDSILKGIRMLGILPKTTAKASEH
ncbi:MAG TPA: hypothetical protein VN843_04345, partial [Anaerolineales bacterium]|nr:hypothetical protein [Anaerolineales bacterium]